MDRVYDISFSIFGKLTHILDSVFLPLKKKLVSAGMDVDYKKYASFIIMVFVFFLIISLIISLFFIFFFLKNISEYAPIIIFGNIIVSLGFALFAYYYPFLVSSDRKSRIDNQLPFASLYLSTISKSGFPAHEMFRMLGNFKNYKIIAEEAKKISKDITLLGFDLPEAINRAIKRSPSKEWNELLSGIRNTVTVGGELGKFLEEKSIGFIQDYKRKLKKFSETVSVFMNVYITVIIVGIVFFIVISSLMSTIGGMSVVLIKTMQMAVVFFGLPIVTVGFILLVKSMSPWSK